MEAIILAGGFGTRLSHIIKDIPKPMAFVCKKPFLLYVINDLIKKGIKKIIIAVGYKKEIIKNYFGYEYNNCQIIYSEENEPLFTGGAIKKALGYCKTKNIFVVNGDTFFDVDLKKMFEFHLKKNSYITIACKKMFDFDRYGTVKIENGYIKEFKEKSLTKEGYINGGIYVINRECFNYISEKKFSFETDFLEREIKNKSIYSFLSDGYFIDIGIAQDYYKAQEDFAKNEQSSLF
jgi:Nucleoside-diphosphate-sugar pyrophosphorylase involved in lipopolysaccharide biosynthesis/translation initiation factor 2B, gamma/epsilon subunits (eIF-2Bgamma/eIF-2Bepsilon)